MMSRKFRTLAAWIVATSALAHAQLDENSVHRRAVEAVIWGMPVVNYDLMYQAAVQANGGFNRIIYWSRLPDWKIQTLTPNPDSIYLTPFINTKNVGPMVVEIPPVDQGSITGTIMDVWQCALEDVGPAGVDKGRGGKYLILPPGYKAKLPAGYIPMPYRLTVPAKAPVKQYWSAPVYDRATHAPIRHARWPSRSSHTPGLQTNNDGSVDVHFGPAAPSGKESNWVPTSSEGVFEVLFRFYGPEKPLFDKTWKLPDIERVSEATSSSRQ
jgi:hypothetical protein